MHGLCAAVDEGSTASAAVPRDDAGIDAPCPGALGRCGAEIGSMARMCIVVVGGFWFMAIPLDRQVAMEFVRGTVTFGGRVVLQQLGLPKRRRSPRAVIAKVGRLLVRSASACMNSRRTLGLSTSSGFVRGLEQRAEVIGTCLPRSS